MHWTLTGGTAYDHHLILTIAKVKKANVVSFGEINNDTDVEMRCPTTYLCGLIPIVIFLNAKHPIPELLHGGPEERSVALMVLNNVANEIRLRAPTRHVQELLDQTQTAEPFLLGNLLSLLDLLVAPISEYASESYQKALTREITLWTNSYSP
jgi:hypothetical protein